MNSSTSSRLQMRLCIELRYPGFDRHYEISSKKIKAYAFESIDGREWYCEFRQRVFNAIDQHRFLPVYRMCDGEFIFALGRSSVDLLPLWRLSFRGLAQRIRKWFPRTYVHRSGSQEYGYEVYGENEIGVARNVFVSELRKVADKGILALCLHNTPLSQPYVSAILSWFDENRVPIHRYNYYHFYHVYALMHGPDRFILLKGRNVLVVTHLTDEKRMSIEAGLRRIGVEDILFLPISRNKALLDKIDLGDIWKPVDVVLVGAGIGSVNILSQLEPLQTACLDVGFALSTLANPELRWNRPFCVPDDEFDLTKVRWLRK